MAGGCKLIKVITVEIISKNYTSMFKVVSWQ